MNSEKINRLKSALEQYDNNMKRANYTEIKAAKIKYECEYNEEQSNDAFYDSIEKLANRKRAILKYTFPKFIEVYNTICKIQFNKKTQGIRELYTNSFFETIKINISDSIPLEPLNMTEKQLVASIIFNGIAGTIVKESELEITHAIGKRKRAEIYKEMTEAKIRSLDMVCWYIDETAQLLSSLNFLFKKVIDRSNNTIQEKGYSAENYSDEDARCFGICIEIAYIIKKIIDTPIIDKRNTIIKGTEELLIGGRYYIEQYNKMV